jgi:hypothetical protein
VFKLAQHSVALPVPEWQPQLSHWHWHRRERRRAAPATRRRPVTVTVTLMWPLIWPRPGSLSGGANLKAQLGPREPSPVAPAPTWPRTTGPQLKLHPMMMQSESSAWCPGGVASYFHRPSSRSKSAFLSVFKLTFSLIITTRKYGTCGSIMHRFE